jgi:hypothetical protein
MVLMSTMTQVVLRGRMIGDNWQLVMDEPVEFEKWPVEVRDCKKISYHFRGTYGIYPNLKKKIEGCQHVTSWT